MRKALYGLRESPRTWYDSFNDFVEKLGFERSKYNYCWYKKVKNGKILYLLVFVDDILMCGKNKNYVDKVKLKCLWNLSKKTWVK